MSRLDEMVLLRAVPELSLEAELARRRAGGRREKQPRLSQMAAEAVRQGPMIASTEDLAAYSIEDFCRAHSISRSALYSQ